ncbi:unnamed protein product [Closterium sp. NIES-65]|nr:unnamed protein product [Closterium sp. NIES-65]
MADDQWFHGAALSDIGRPSSDPPSAASSTGPPPQTGRMSAGTRRTVKGAGSGTPSKGAAGGMTAGKKRMAAVTEKAVGLKDRLRQAREEVLELRQDACDMQEYASAKLARAQTYLQLLAKKAHGLDQVAQEAESKVAPLKKERRRLFNSLIQSKGNIRVVCRVRPAFEHEDSLALSFPDETTIRINPSASVAATASASAGRAGSPGSLGGGGGSSGLAKRDYELDHIYGPHVGQGDLFVDAVQPMVQAVMDGFNASIIAYGQSGSGKSHTMEGPSHDRGVFYRAFDEIYDLANSTYAPADSYTFHVSVLEMFNEQLSDLLVNPLQAGHGSLGKYCTHTTTTRVVIVRVHHGDPVTGEQQSSKLLLADLASSERLLRLIQPSGHPPSHWPLCVWLHLRVVILVHVMAEKLIANGIPCPLHPDQHSLSPSESPPGWGGDCASASRRPSDRRAAGQQAAAGGSHPPLPPSPLSPLSPFTVHTRVVIVRVHHDDPVTGEQQDSKLLLADLASSERLLASSSASGDRLTASLHVQKSFSALGDCLSALTGKRPTVPYGNSKLTMLLSDCLGTWIRMFMPVLLLFLTFPPFTLSLSFKPAGGEAKLPGGGAKTVVVVTCSPRWGQDGGCGDVQPVNARMWQSRWLSPSASPLVSTSSLSSSLTLPGGEAKTVMVVTCSPSVKDVAESALSLAFAARSRNSELSLGTQREADSRGAAGAAAAAAAAICVEFHRDFLPLSPPIFPPQANDARREVFESERQTAEVQQEVLRLKDALRASEQTGCVLLTELQRAWAQAGLVEAQHHAEVERLMAEVAAGVEAQRRMEEEWETRAVLEGAKTVREHEEEMERVQQQHIAEIEAYKVQVEQLHGRLAEAAEMAATVAALRRPQEDSAEVAELRQRYEAAVQKMTAYKNELEKSEALTRVCMGHRVQGESHCSAGREPLQCRERATAVQGESHCSAGREPLQCRERATAVQGESHCSAGREPLQCRERATAVQGESHCSAGREPLQCSAELNAENASLLSRLEATNSALAALENSALMKVDAHVQAQAQAQAVTANGTAGHGDGGAGAGDGTVVQQQQQQQQQQQGQGNGGKQGVPAAAAAAAAAVTRVGAGGLQSQQQVGSGGGEWERRRDEVVGRMNRVMVDAQSDAAALAEESNACLREMLTAVAALPAGSEEEGRAAEEVRAAVVALLAWAHSKALSLEWPFVSCARLLLLRVLRSKSADVQSSKVPAIERFLEKALPQPAKPALQKSSTFALPTTATPAPGSTLRTFRLDLKLPGGDKGAAGAGAGGGGSASIADRRGSASFRLPSFRAGGKKAAGAGGNSAVKVSEARIREIRQEAADHAKGHKELALVFAHVATAKPTATTTTTPLSHPSSLPADLIARVADVTSLEQRVLQWIGSQFGFWAASEPPRDAQEDVVAVAAAVVEGWREGLGTFMRYSEDALGQVLADWSFRQYRSQLGNLKVLADWSFSQLSNLKRGRLGAGAGWLELQTVEVTAGEPQAGGVGSSLLVEEADDMEHVIKLRLGLKADVGSSLLVEEADDMEHVIKLHLGLKADVGSSLLVEEADDMEHVIKLRISLVEDVGSSLLVEEADDMEHVIKLRLGLEADVGSSLLVEEADDMEHVIKLRLGLEADVGSSLLVEEADDMEHVIKLRLGLEADVGSSLLVEEADDMEHVIKLRLGLEADVGSSLLVEEADDMEHVIKLRLGLEAVRHKRAKLLRDVAADASLGAHREELLEGQKRWEAEGGVKEESRIGSLAALEKIFRACQDAMEALSASRMPADQEVNGMREGLARQQREELPVLAGPDKMVGEQIIAYALQFFPVSAGVGGLGGSGILALLREQQQGPPLGAGKMVGEQIIAYALQFFPFFRPNPRSLVSRLPACLSVSSRFRKPVVLSVRQVPSQHHQHHEQQQHSGNQEQQEGGGLSRRLFHDGEQAGAPPASHAGAASSPARHSTSSAAGTAAGAAAAAHHPSSPSRHSATGSPYRRPSSPSRRPSSPSRSSLSQLAPSQGGPALQERAGAGGAAAAGNAGAGGAGAGGSSLWSQVTGLVDGLGRGTGEGADGGVGEGLGREGGGESAAAAGLSTEGERVGMPATAVGAGGAGAAAGGGGGGGAAAAGSVAARQEEVRRRAEQEGVREWTAVQLNSAEGPLVIKCGATHHLQLAIKYSSTAADTAGGAGAGGAAAFAAKTTSGSLEPDTLSVLPDPSSLSGLSLDRIRSVLLPLLPAPIVHVIVAKSANATRARYGRIHSTLAARVPVLRGAPSSTGPATSRAAESPTTVARPTGSYSAASTPGRGVSSGAGWGGGVKGGRRSTGVGGVGGSIGGRGDVVELEGRSWSRGASLANSVAATPISSSPLHGPLRGGGGMVGGSVRMSLDAGAGGDGGGGGGGGAGGKALKKSSSMHEFPDGL